MTMYRRGRAAQLALVCLASAYLQKQCSVLAIHPEELARARPSRARTSCCRRRDTEDTVPRRILYNINHVKLVSDEVPLLLSLGYEVYIPKHLPANIDYATSSGVINKFDKSLSISRKARALLDAHNFYDEMSWGSDSDELARVIDGNFCMVITAAYSTPVVVFLNRLSIPVGIRAFGHAVPMTYSASFSPEAKELILAHKGCRCFFLSAYAHLAEVEKELKDIFLFAPVTLGPESPSFEREVTRNAVLFQCSRVNVSPYYTEKANKFLADFGSSGMDVAMYGTELAKFNDTHNLGRLSTREISRLFSSYSAMYYDSVEPRHLHYHPLEAMYARMPVVFLQQGMLARLMPYSPAKSRDVGDAQRKLRRLVEGDVDFEAEIVWHQNALLQTLKRSNTVHEWRAVLSRVGCKSRRESGCEARERPRSPRGCRESILLDTQRLHGGGKGASAISGAAATTAAVATRTTVAQNRPLS